MKQFKKTLIVLTIMLIASISISDAYTLQKFGWKTTYVPIRNAAGPAYEQTIIDSINAWNRAIPEVYFYLDKNAPNAIYSGNYKESWVGYYQYYTRNGKTYKFNIYLNNRLLSKRSSNYKQSVLVHELGHALCLSDNPAERKSIMRYDRNRNYMIKPQRDDIKGVIKAYNLN